MSESETEFGRALQAVFEDREERSRAGAAAYAALKKSGKLASHRVMSYRCAHRCLLLDVMEFPEPVGLIFHLPRYRLSPAVNDETSSPEGRAKNTEDGDRRWKAHTAAETFAAALNCDHLHHLSIRRERIQADLDAGPRGRVIILTQADHDPVREVEWVTDDTR
ncbi:hypothetical protein ACTHQ1_05080 [Janibacter anophelis]|uniref:hypothetical protein n=1 Tax=Janibacter anophelis TaxID=319054 RepID=UPI003F7F06D1